MRKLGYERGKEILEYWIIVVIVLILAVLISCFHEVNFISIGILIFFSILFFLPGTIICIKENTDYKKIVKNGIKTKGKICKYTMMFRDSNKPDLIYKPIHSFRKPFIWPAYKITEIEYSLLIEYVDPCTQELKKIATPALNFNPKDKLGGFECSVYVYNSKVYVTDFVERKKGQECIWTEEEIKNMEK